MNQRADLGFCSWDGQDSNLRPTDYEVGGARVASRRSIRPVPRRARFPGSSCRPVAPIMETSLSEVISGSVDAERPLTRQACPPPVSDLVDGP